MDTTEILKRLSAQRFFAGQIMHVEHVPERPARYAEPAAGLHPQCRAMLQRRGIERLYSHQADALDRVRAGASIVLVTGTASGKTLCYTVPALEALAEDSLATMLFVYPTKALAQDQLRALRALQEPAPLIPFLAGAYDGDTPANLRRKLRDGGSIILTNPDMLHQGILPQHARWNRFFTHLRYVVLDEVHAYRGVFGSHVANTLRRLRRICAHYGSDPRFICASATIANAAEHASRICGVPVEAVAGDGSPRGGKCVVLWNPPPVERAAAGAARDWRVGGERRSALREAAELLSLLVQEHIQTLAFVRTRLAAELLHKDCRERLRQVSTRLAESVHAYRGGYLPEERRAIERRLASGELLGVASTNALELGIDIGSLDACLLIGYPGSVASFWQQAGRAGRGREEAMVFLLAQNTPVDQFLMAHTDYLFARPPEQAVIDPDNAHVAVGHLQCAAAELPLREDEIPLFGPCARTILDLLEDDRCLHRAEGQWYWASSRFPAADVNLRALAGPVYTIQDETDKEKIVGTLDETSALAQLHTHAVYLHGAETYFVNRLDTEQKIAFVEKRDLDYYTQSVQVSDIRIDERESERDWRGGRLGFGDVTVTSTIPMFKKIRFHSRDSLGWEKLDLPPQELETTSLWFVPPPALVADMLRRRLIPGEGLIGIANALVELAPVIVMCDTTDIGTVVDARNLGADALFLHDRYPGGMGFARRCGERFDALMRTAASVVRNCACRDGCPSCVGSPLPAAAMTDLDSAVRGRIPDKQAARFLLDRLVPEEGDERPAFTPEG